MYTGFQTDWFNESYDELIAEVNRLWNTPLARTIEAKFRARVYFTSGLLIRLCLIQVILEVAGAVVTVAMLMMMADGLGDG